MARADKSARIEREVSEIKRGQFTDYSKAAAHYGCDHTSVSKRIRGFTRSTCHVNSFFRHALTKTQEMLIGRNQLPY
jgi:hypothetical protein